MAHADESAIEVIVAGVTSTRAKPKRLCSTPCRFICGSTGPHDAFYGSTAAYVDVSGLLHVRAMQSRAVFCPPVRVGPSHAITCSGGLIACAGVDGLVRLFCTKRETSLFRERPSLPETCRFALRGVT